MITDKRLSSGQIVQYYRGENNNISLANTNSSGASMILYNDMEQSLPAQAVGTPGGLSAKNAPSLSALTMNNEPVSTGAQLSIYLLLTEAMHKSIPKKKIENQVRVRLSPRMTIVTLRV